MLHPNKLGTKTSFSEHLKLVDSILPKTTVQSRGTMQDILNENSSYNYKFSLPGNVKRQIVEFEVQNALTYYTKRF